MASFNRDWVLYNDGVLSLMRPELEIALDESQLDPRIWDPILDALGFVTKETRFPKWIVTSRGWVLALKEIGENEERPRMNYANGAEKGYAVKMYGWSYSITKLALKTIKDSGLDKAMFHPTVVSELEELGNNIRQLGYSAKIAKVDEATRLLTSGFVATSSYWPGSPAPDWYALFSASHASGNNLMASWSTALLTQVNLEAAIAKLRAIKNDVGAIYKLPSMFLLVVWPTLELKARKLLNNMSGMASQVVDVVINNSITVNTFTSIDWFKVGLLVLESIGQPDANWVAIGTGAEWFLLDQNRLKLAQALVLRVLWNDEVDNYIDQRTKEFVIDIDLAFSIEHHKAEIGIVGSLWV